MYLNFVLPIINIIKDEHVNDSKYINRNCSYLTNICYERYFELSKDKYYKIKKFIDDNIDTFESINSSIYLSNLTLSIHIKNVIIITVIVNVVIIV